MKYIKKYENSIYKGKYWKIRTDEPYLLKSLEYLGEKYTNSQKNAINRFSFMLSPEWKKEREKINHSVPLYIFIILEEGNDWNYWNWELTENEFILKDYEYMGNLEKLTPEDLEKIEIRENAKKYNL